MDPHGSAWICIHFPSWIQIRIQVGKFATKNGKNARKLLITAALFSVFKANLHNLYCFLLFSILLCFLQLKKTFHDFFSSNLVKLDLDLNPDPYKVNVDPQPWFF